MNKEQVHLYIGLATPMVLVIVLLYQLQQSQQSLTQALIQLSERQAVTPAEIPAEESPEPEATEEESPDAGTEPTEPQLATNPDSMASTVPAQANMPTGGGTPPPVEAPSGDSAPEKMLPGELVTSASEIEPPAPVSTVTQVTYQPVTNNHFYPRLQPFGIWFLHPIHGRVWMPHASKRDRKWRPYAQNGQWHYTREGWHWHSNYSWGGTTFHHGRWFWHPERNGWVWVPGREWSPAWVRWRDAGENIGWAPIPPVATITRDANESTQFAGTSGVHLDYGLESNHFTFVPKSRFLNDNPIQFVLDQDDALIAFHDSLVRGRSMLSAQRKWTNFGIPRHEMAQDIGHPIPIVAIDLRNPYQPRVLTLGESRETPRQAPASRGTTEGQNAGQRNNTTTQQTRVGRPFQVIPGNTAVTVSGNAPAIANPAPLVYTSGNPNTGAGMIQPTTAAGRGFRQGQSRPNLSVRKPPSGR